MPSIHAKLLSSVPSLAGSPRLKSPHNTPHINHLHLQRTSVISPIWKLSPFQYVQTPNSDYLLDAFLPRSADGAALDLCEDFAAVLRRNLCRVGGQSPEKKYTRFVR
ncbi:hypothetical protein GEV33_010299 [Tenebrio molitor]|uniref:Uncharacterized protein n=1 Tax=Tenebrio molitor TaxID=7067 RepID=A0A8J6HDH2_TENMO|nr:hypothetical protein GEV33_010299 [Tenebrio molitor]